MSWVLNEEVVGLLKNLIRQVSNYTEGTKEFVNIENRMAAKLKNADSMSFVNQKDIDEAMESMKQKFLFHGFFTQADQLEKAYGKYMLTDISKSESTNRLNVVKFLLSLSESPTTYFWKNPNEFVYKEADPQEEINWGEYLNEGIKMWCPSGSEDDTGLSDTSSTSSNEFELPGVVDSKESKRTVIIDDNNTDVIIDFRANREELLNTIQHTWYNSDRCTMYPPSDWEDAKVGIIWEEYLKDQVKGLISIKSSSIISEYKVMREIIWQLFQPHPSTVFELHGDEIQPRSNITISSVRLMPFTSFMSEFIPYIELLDYFRRFEASLLECTSTARAETYKSYLNSLKNILQPVYLDIVQIEDKVREQESTMTLLKLASDLKELFEPLVVLKRIHEDVTREYHHESPMISALDLLHRLHKSLQYSCTKMEHDIKIALYLDTLYFFFKVSDSWLMKNDFMEDVEEFVIRRYKDELEPWRMDFAFKDDVLQDYKQDKILRIFCEDVLEVGRNLRLLRQLGKYQITYENLGLDTSKMESMHDDFIHRILQDLCKYYEEDRTNILTAKSSESLSSQDSTAFKYPVICIDSCKKATEMDKLENLVDQSDGFLMKAFESYFKQAPEVSIEMQPTLYEKISKTTKSLFPTQYYLEKAFSDILKERFTISGLLVKNLLIEDYKLDKQFEFLRHVFLFDDDFIFPFYRRFFQNVLSSNKNWGNKIRLTSHLQDIIMDTYPEFYDKCNVDVKEYWKQCTDILDPLKLLTISFKVDWPLNIIITLDHLKLYQEVFQLFFKLKWSLYVTNHLSFRDIECNGSCKSQSKEHKYKVITTRLKYLRFCLLDILNSVQHYIFGYIFNTCLKKFELDFEKSSDLRTLMVAHADFIESVHTMVVDILGTVHCRSGFNALLHSVKLLHALWYNISEASNEKLDDCYSYYKAGFDNLIQVVNPMYFFSY